MRDNISNEIGKTIINQCETCQCVYCPIERMMFNGDNNCHLYVPTKK